MRGTIAESIGLGVTWVGGPGSFQTLGTVTDTTTGWTEITGSAVAPAGVTSEYLSLYGNDTGGFTTYLDDVVVDGGTSTPAVLLGATNAAAVVLGNDNEVGATTLQGGGGGVNITAGTGDTITIAGTNNNIVTIGGTTTTEPITTQAEGITDTISGSPTAPSDIIKTTTNSTNAFQVQNAAGTSLLGVDTANSQETLGTSNVSTFGNTYTNATNPVGRFCRHRVL